MKNYSIVFSALFAFASTATADGDYRDVKESVPGISDAGNSPSVNTQDLRVPQTSIGNGWGTGKGDAKKKMYIGETEKNLSGGGRGWGR